MAIIAPIVSTFDNKGVERAGKSFGNFSRTVGRQLKNVAAAAVGIGVAVGAASLKAISAASDLDEAVSATRQIFGQASDAVLKFADDAALAFGISKQEALDGALTLGTFGKAAGLADDDLSDFTNGLLGLSADIASFRNATPEEAIEAIGAALRGESEPLRRFGVLLDDATLKAEALELGIYDGNGALTQQQKILAAESAIYKQTADAQGDFARTSGGLANQQRILRARLSNVTAQLGVQLLPIALKVANFFADKFLPAVENLADTFAEKGLLGVLGDVWNWTKQNATESRRQIRRDGRPNGQLDRRERRASDPQARRMAPTARRLATQYRHTVVAREDADTRLSPRRLYRTIHTPSPREAPRVAYSARQLANQHSSTVARQQDARAR